MRRAWSPLKNRADFLRIAATGLRRVTPAFILQAAACAAGQTGRVGFTVSRKVGNAVSRNRARRRLRAVADTVMATGAGDALDFVLIGRGEALTRDFTAMTNDLRHAMERLRKGEASPSKPRRRP
jgi:ribonuclease P protein component